MHPAPAPAPVPVPAPMPVRKVAAPPPAPIGTTCPADVTTIGRAIAPSEALPSDGTKLRASADPESCLIAAWSDERPSDERPSDEHLYVSWDGGASFAKAALPNSAFYHVDASNDRVIVVLDDRLGVLQRGDTSPTYRTLPVHLKEYSFSQAGRWLAIYVPDGVTVTGDDGLTWRTITMPPGNARWSAAGMYRLDADGTIVAHGSQTDEWLAAHPSPSEEDYDETLDSWYVRRADAKAWRRVSRASALAPRRTATGWSYAFETDKSWGCGSSQKLVATHGRKHEEVQGDLRPDVRDIALAYGSHGAFLQTYFELDGPMLAELVGAEPHHTPIPFEWNARLVGVDGAGTPILTADGRLLRWSKSGGWRVLLDARASSN